MTTATTGETVNTPVAPPRRPLTPEERALAAGIAEGLREWATGARRRIGQIVRTVGAARAEVLFTQAQAVEAAGGLRTDDGSRRRTPGGVFFHLVRVGVTDAERLAIWGRVVGGGSEAAAGSVPPRPAPPLLEPWDAVAVAAVAALTVAEMGGATSVKITVVGRPGKVVERDAVVAVAVVSTGVPSLPKGLPTPAAARTRYIVLIPRKQWAKAAAALTDPNDVLIAEGYPALEERFAGAITVYATRVTTKRLQAAQKAGTTAEAPVAPARE